MEILMNKDNDFQRPTRAAQEKCHELPERVDIVVEGGSAIEHPIEHPIESENRIPTGGETYPKGDTLPRDTIEILIDENAEPHEILDRAAILGRDGRWVAGWALRFIIMAIATYIAWLGLGKVWIGLLPILLAILVCTVLWPPVRWLRNHGFPSALAVATTLFGFFAIIGGIFAAMAPSVATQSTELYEKASDGLEKLQTWIQGPPLNLQVDEVTKWIDDLMAKIQEQTSNIASGVATGVSAASNVVITLLVMLVLTFFFLKDGPKFLPMVRRFAGPEVGWHLTEVLSRTWNTLAGYIRAQAIVSLIDAIVIGAGLMLLQVPLAGVLAVLTFFAGFVPIVGAVTAGAVAVLVALVSNGVTTALLVLALVIAVQQLEGNVLSPILQSKAMNLHPVIVLLSVTVGSSLFGIVGAFLAVPIAAAIAVWVRYHSELVSLRAGEITADEIEIATANQSNSSLFDEEAFSNVKGMFARMSKGHPKKDTDTKAEDLESKN